MKKLLSLLFVLLFVFFVFSACGKREVFPLVIDGVKIPGGVYSYYFDEVSSNSKKYGAKENDSKSAAQKTEELCKKYAALQVFCEKNGIKVEQYLKSEANDKTNGLWSLFGSYYKRIGVSKADILKVTLCGSEKKQIVVHFFGKGGKNEVSQDNLKQSFVELYAGFKAIEAPLSKVNTKGETIPLSEKEKAELEEEFELMAKRLRTGTDIDTINREYCKKQNLVATQDLPVNLVKKNDVMYDDGFFEKINAISHGSADVIESESTIYLALRVTIATNDEDAFAQYENEVLEYLKMPWVEKKIEANAKKCSVQKNERAIKRLQKQYKTATKEK